MINTNQRIVSLLPSATEILHFLGIEDRLVGVSHDCDWPESVRDYPTVSESEINTDGDARSIDRQVKKASHAGKSLYHVNSERLDPLDPDLIITQEQCEVCAPSFDEVKESCRLLDGDPDVISLEPSDLDGVIETIRIIGESTNTLADARELIENLRSTRERIRSLCEPVPDDPTVLTLEWIQPPFVGGHWIPEMVSVVGGGTYRETGEHSVEVDWADLEAYDPDKIILMPCGYRTERAVQDGKALLEGTIDTGCFSLENCSVYAVNGSFYFSRPGPRLWEGLKILAATIQPSVARQLNLPDGSYKKLA